MEGLDTSWYAGWGSLALINAGIYPRIPSKGSVGASGDLAPLAHMAGVLIGAGEARVNGEIVPAATALENAGLEPIRAETEIYLADTLGELGIFYGALPIAFIGGSLVEHGGHNPMEAARLGCAVIFGPHMVRFDEDVRLLTEAGAAVQVSDADALQAVV